MTILGWEEAGGEPIILVPEARARGVYVVGTTGMGKTTLLQSIAYQDMAAGHGVCVLDPHGDMIDWLLERVPEGRMDDVILFNPADEDHPFGLNLLACDRDDPKQVRWVVATITSTLRRLYEWSWGPRLDHVLGHTLWTAMAIPDSTLIEVLLLLSDSNYRRYWVKRIDEPLLLNFWEEFPEKSLKERLEFVSSTVNKLTPFLLDSSLRMIVGQSKNTFDMRKIMDEGKILLVNLSKGDLGENNSALLGSVLVNLILITALSRRDMALTEREKRPFHVIVDEYQNFASESFSVLQSEARKYAVDLVVAHQFRDQLSEETRGSALNVGNFISFRTTGTDGQELAAQFDNTPPEPEIIYQPKMFEAQRMRGEEVTYKPGRAYVAAKGPQRLYSDMMMQKANILANLPPYAFEARIIEPKPDPLDPSEKKKRLVLGEHLLMTIDPSPERTDKSLLKRIYGEPVPERADRIRRQSQDKADPKAEVEAEIYRRTLRRAGMKVPIRMKQQVAAAEEVEEERLSEYLTPDYKFTMMNG
jgi:DNA segregation ATPase FtsK/SpoIIIE-like protein